MSIFVVTPVYMPEDPRETRLRSQAVHGGSGDRKQANWLCHVDMKNPLASLARMAWEEIPYCLRLPEKVLAVTLGMPPARRTPRSTHSLRTLRSAPPGGAAQMCAPPADSVSRRSSAYGIPKMKVTTHRKDSVVETIKTRVTTVQQASRERLAAVHQVAYQRSPPRWVVAAAFC